MAIGDEVDSPHGTCRKRDAWTWDEVRIRLEHLRSAVRGDRAANDAELPLDSG
jgi:hypothetical protein